LFSRSLDLTCVFWKAEQSDGRIIYEGPQQYQSIDRTKLERFSLNFKNRPLIEVGTKNRVLVARRKRRNQTSLVSGVTVPIGHFWIVALLAKPKSKETTQHVSCEFDPGWENQLYDIDSEESSIHYLFENGKTQINTRFGKMTPFTPLHLRSEEFKELMGFEDPTKRKNEFL